MVAEWRRLAYGGGGPLDVVNSDGGNARALVALPTCNPNWSPDGKHLTFFPGATCAELYGSLYRIDADGSHRRPLASSRPGCGSRPCEVGDADWSPDGSKIAYTDCEHLASSDVACDIFVIKPDGSGKHRLALAPGFTYAWVEWAAGGKEILSSEAGQGVLATNVSTGRLRKLFPGSSTAWGCSLAGVSRDGQSIAANACWDARIAVATLSAREPQLVRVPNGWKYNQSSVYLP